MLILIVAAAAMVLTACTFEFDKYDDDEYIIKSNSGSRYMSVSSMTNDGQYWKVKSFGGVSKMKSDVELEANASLTLTLDYIGGAFKIVAIKDDVVYKLIENEDCSGTLATTLAAGTYTIKAVGSNAEFEMTYKF